MPTVSTNKPKPAPVKTTAKSDPKPEPVYTKLVILVKGAKPEQYVPDYMAELVMDYCEDENGYGPEYVITQEPSSAAEFDKAWAAA